MRFLNASVLERKSLNRNLSCGFPLGNLLPKTRVLEHQREPNLGGHFGPEKNIYPPPPKFPEETLPAPLAPPPLLGDPPPFGIFNNPPPRQPCRPGLLLPLPRAEKK